jgi:hypothetical protein
MGSSNFVTGPISYFAIIMAPYRVQPSRCEKPKGHWCSTSSGSSCDRWCPGALSLQRLDRAADLAAFHGVIASSAEARPGHA